MTTAYVTHPLCTGHAIPGHPERPARAQAVWQALDESGLAARMQKTQPPPIDDEPILWVHTKDYLDMLNRCAEHAHGMRFDADTLALPETPGIARISAGGVMLAVDQVMSGDANNALAITRPPGHHAIPDRAMGFCFLNNIAIAARRAQKQHGVEKVMIVDYDVHHGNGTQDMFYRDDSVLFVSTHQYPYYPGSGAINETGADLGLGYTLNIPLTPGHGDDEYAELFRQIVWPAARRFQPELILVSAGFDGHWDDPLANMNLSLAGYAHLTRELIAMGEALCDGRIVFVMEGGYDLDVLANGILNVAHALLGDSTVVDPLGPGRKFTLDVKPLIDRLRSTHNL